MSTRYAEFAATVRGLAPRTAVVLGSGLAGATTTFTEHASVPFEAIPGLVPTSVRGHKGRLAVGRWGEVPVLLFGGRLHYYEGHPWDVVTGTVRAAAELGVVRLVLTNAAGGIHASLRPGSLMAIRGHLKVVNAGAWRELARGSGILTLYSANLLRDLHAHEAAAGRELVSGVYAALTGPSYETPAEIRALRSIGADAVGMSTAAEAEAATALGLEVAGISCVTNAAAGIGGQPLDHHEVLANAKLAVSRLGEFLSALVRAA